VQKVRRQEPAKSGTAAGWKEKKRPVNKRGLLTDNQPCGATQSKIIAIVSTKSAGAIAMITLVLIITPIINKKMNLFLTFITNTIHKTFLPLQSLSFTNDTLCHI
jgi:hypothetical protein